MDLTYLRELNLASVALRLTMAVVFGGLIGLERGRKRRPAGFRTYMLACLGATLTMMLGQYEFYMLDAAREVIPALENLRTDVSRFGAQVINGIGFLGAGTIIVTGHQGIKGVTTAAGLWASACMGLAIGAGFYECVILAFVLIFLVMRLLPGIEASIVENSRIMNVYLELRSLDHIGDVLDRVKEQGAQIFEVDIDHGREERRPNPSAILTLTLDRHVPHTQVLSGLSDLDCICTIDEI